MAKKKTTKQVRAIDRIIKFQIDDGIESLTIGGKTDLADLEIDSKQNVTLHLNADADKLNEVKSLVPFITIRQKTTGKDPDKKKTAELIQDLRGFALELAEDSKQLAEIIKEESSITLDLSQLIRRLNKMVDDIDTAQRTADRAEGKADNAQETADRAETKAGNAESLAISAETSAKGAFNKAVSVEKELKKLNDVEYFEHPNRDGFITRYEVINFISDFGYSPYGERQTITMVKVKNHNNRDIDINLWDVTNKGTIIGNIFGVVHGTDYSDTLPPFEAVVGAKLTGNIVNGHLLASITEATAPDLMIYIVIREFMV